MKAGKQGHEYQEGGPLGSIRRQITTHGPNHRLPLIPLYVKAARLLVTYEAWVSHSLLSSYLISVQFEEKGKSRESNPA